MGILITAMDKTIKQKAFLLIHTITEYTSLSAPLRSLKFYISQSPLSQRPALLSDALYPIHIDAVSIMRTIHAETDIAL